MRTLLKAIPALALLALAPFGLAEARDVVHGAIKIEQPWSRATPGGAKVGAGFMKITNTGTEPDRLLSAEADIAGVVEIHEMAMEDGIMKMRALGDGLVIPPGTTVELKPGGYHVMFIDLKSPIVEASPVKARLVFEKAGAVDVELAIQPIGSKAPAGDGHHQHKH